LFGKATTDLPLAKEAVHQNHGLGAFVSFKEKRKKRKEEKKQSRARTLKTEEEEEEEKSKRKMTLRWSLLCFIRILGLCWEKMGMSSSW
jgi:hypothetical protein